MLPPLVPIHIDARGRSHITGPCERPKRVDAWPKAVRRRYEELLGKSVADDDCSCGWPAADHGSLLAINGRKAVA